MLSAECLANSCAFKKILIDAFSVDVKDVCRLCDDISPVKKLHLD